MYSSQEPQRLPLGGPPTYNFRDNPSREGTVRGSPEFNFSSRGPGDILAKTPSVGRPRTPPGHTLRDRLNDSFGDGIISRVPLGVEQSPLYGHLSASDTRGESVPPYLSYPLSNGGRDKSPFNGTSTSESSSCSGWRSDGTTGNPSLYLPHVRTNRMSQGFPEPNADPTHGAIAQMASELKRMSTIVERLVDADKERTRMLDDLLSCIEKLGDRVNTLEDATEGGHPPKRMVASGGSNDHPSLKPVVHDLFYEMCGVDAKSSKGKCTTDLCSVRPLDNGEAFELVGGAKLWHPDWLGEMGKEINKEFVNAAMDLVWKNEESLRENGMGVITNVDYTKPAVVECVKIYWCNVHKQATLREDQERYHKTLDSSRLHGRRQAHTRARRQAAKDNCIAKGISFSEAVAIIDTDFASEPRTCGSDTDASEDTANRRLKAGLGDGSKKSIGLEWRSPDYVTFLRWLSFKSANAKVGRDGQGAGEPATKRRRTTTGAAKGFKKDFDPSPSQLSDRPPSSQKRQPLRSMVASWWLQSHPDVSVVDHGAHWLSGFHSTISREDIHSADWDHIEELTAWHEEKEREENVKMLNPS
ncbi:hypothetical protein BC826DRAFT_1110691 [Russula brevipes]|nr:hypothetical protein BC826DRAFT_1110691 [Russula brevipes]